MELQSCLKGALPFAAMVIVECGEVGMITLGKAAMNKGLSNLVYVVYYNTLGTLLLLPYFIIHTRRLFDIYLIHILSLLLCSHLS